MDKKIAVPENVQRSDFGCSQCLWAGIECKDGSKYVPTPPESKRASKCDSYTYYD